MLMEIQEIDLLKDIKNKTHLDMFPKRGQFVGYESKGGSTTNIDDFMTQTQKSRQRRNSTGTMPDDCSTM